MLTLRDYQSVAVHRVFDAWRAGYRSVVLVAPTGCGKRYIALWLMDYAAKAGRRVLFVGNRRLLITQAQNDAEQFGITHGVIMADAESGDPASTNQLASIQTLESWYFYDKFSSELSGRGLPPADLLVIDEGHQDIQRVSQLLALYPLAKVLVLTATPVGAEGRAIVPSPYETLVEPVLNSELIANGRLLPTTVYAPSEPSIEGVRIERRGEYNQSQLGQRVAECTIFADVFTEWQRLGAGRATVCFVPGIPYGRDIARRFNDLLGTGSAYLIEAKTKHAEREKIFEEVAAEKCQVLVSCDVLREGFDLPLLSCGIDLQPNSQLRSYWQKIGRIKRPHGVQSGALWLDFAGNSWRFPHPDTDPEWPQGGEQTTQEVIKKNREVGKEAAPIVCPNPACKYVRQHGSVCPKCGHKGVESIRTIRMKDGSLRHVQAKELNKRVKTEDERLYGQWQSAMFVAIKSGMTYSQAAAMYRKKTGHQPKQHWPFVFPRDHLQWRRRPQQEHSARDIVHAFRSGKP